MQTLKEGKLKAECPRSIIPTLFKTINNQAKNVGIKILIVERESRAKQKKKKRQENERKAVQCKGMTKNEKAEGKNEDYGKETYLGDR